MNHFKKTGIKAIQWYGKYNPTVWIPFYFRQQRRKKFMATHPSPLSNEVKKKIKDLWGRNSWWFDFYNAIGEKEKAHLYFPDPWFIRFIDAKENDWKVCMAVDDKCFYDFYFADVNRPKTVVKVCNGILMDKDSSIMSLHDAANLCRQWGG